MYYFRLFQYIYTLNFRGGNPEACIDATIEDPVTC